MSVPNSIIFHLHSNAIITQPDIVVENKGIEIQNPAAIPEGVTSLELALARFCTMLEKKFGSDHNPGHYVYICGDNSELALIPFMMHQWAMTLVCSLFVLHVAE